MIRWEIIVILCLATADMMMTYYLLYKSKASKQKNWVENEQNLIVRFWLKKLGLHNGIRISAAITLTILTAGIIYLDNNYSLLDFNRLIFFTMGVYTIIIVYHIYFIKSFKR